MKGIAPVVATMLLIIIAMTMVGIVASWFFRVTPTVKDAVQSDIDNSTARQEQTIRIVSINTFAPGKVFVASSGKQTVSSSSLAVYIDGALKICTWSISSIPPGAVAECTLTSPCASGSILRVSAPGNIDETEC